MDLLTRKPAGTQCPGSTWKKFLPHRIKKRAESVVAFVFVYLFVCLFVFFSMSYEVR